MKFSNASRKNKIIALVSLVILIFSVVTVSLLLHRPINEQVKTDNVLSEQDKNETKNDQENRYTGAEKDVSIAVREKTEPAAVGDTKQTQVQPKSKWPVTYTLNEAASLTVVVNKKHRLPSDYYPSLQAVAGGQLRAEAANALVRMLAAAENDGAPMRIISSFRSFNTQVATYNKWVRLDGQAQADRSSARPGHSEHQTGLAVDLGIPSADCDLLICFGATAQGKWLASNAHTFGFIVRYESDTESLTGYQYEPWHMRYLGVDVATVIKNGGQTLDQYYGVEAGGY